MKNLLLILTIGLLSSATVMAQDAFKDLKNAEKAIKKYISDNNKADELTKGIQLLESAFASDEVKAVAKTWITKAKVMNNLATTEMKNKTLDETKSYVIAVPTAAIEACDALLKASELSEKKNEKKEIQLTMATLENNLSNFGIISYQNKDYNAAFQNFTRAIKISEALKEMGSESRLDDPALKTEQYFLSSVSAYYDKNFEGAKPYLLMQLEEKSTEPFVYEALFNIHSESDPEAAIGYLNAGREMAPDDTGLLFAEINHYLKVGELDKLITKLELAIEKEPDNISIYNTLGSVYDQLQQKETDKTKSEDYRNKAKGYYEQALEKDPSNFDAQYSIGALYYNKAATYVDKLNDLSADLTPAGMKAYDDTKNEMDAMFKVALPYFEKAEAANAKDLNTIIALKEIYARLNNLEKSNEYKAKYEEIAAGK